MTGLRVGLEVHQELDVGKLFCACSSAAKEKQLKLEIVRRLRSVGGELGEIDRAAEFESRRGMEFVYRGYENEVCLVDTDSEPPHPVNEKALRTALGMARMLKMDIVDELEVMRKTITDGSAITGFQRTMLIGLGNEDSKIETKHGPVRIEHLCLEEDAAKIVKKEKNMIVYSLSRLGIPLIEVGTAADIKNPEQAREVAEKLGMLFRSFPETKRGIGTIRQDINVSIPGSARVEIKGCQDLKAIPDIVKNEVERQKALLEIKERLKILTKDHDLKHDYVMLSSKFEHTKSKVIRKGMEDGVVFGVKLPGFAGLLGMEILPMHRLGTELADVVRIVSGLSGIIHSDELPGYGITTEETIMVRATLNCKKQDAFVLVVGRPEKAEKALKAVVERARQCLKGVPSEVRRVDGLNTRFLRPMPGASRMYPETDTPPIRITKDILESIRLPESLEKKQRRLEKTLGKDLARQIVKSRYFKLFEEVTSEMKIDGVLVATTLLSTMKDMKRKGFHVETISSQDLKDIFGLVSKKKIAKKSVPQALELLTKGRSISQIKKTLEMFSEKELEKIIKEVKKHNPGATKKELLGLVMKKTKGRVDADSVKKLI
jgi:glutamyl-tRNA(Gln) amidotransferase subunit E